MLLARRAREKNRLLVTPLVTFAHGAVAEETAAATVAFELRKNDVGHNASVTSRTKRVFPPSGGTIVCHE